MSARELRRATERERRNIFVPRPGCSTSTPDRLSLPTTRMDGLSFVQQEVKFNSRRITFKNLRT